MDVKRAIALIALSGTLGCAGTPIRGVEEASGVTRHGDRLLIVGDDDPDGYYSYPLNGDEGARIRILPEKLARHRLSTGASSRDLEAIDVLADGRVVVVSERLRALLDDEGVVALFDGTLAELGGRGAEGLAVRRLPDGGSRVATLWEGGYLNDMMPPGAARLINGRALLPRVVCFDIAPGERELELSADGATMDTDLRVPLPPGEEPTAQRFRAPDLVWHRWDVDGEPQWGFVVLISSGWSVRPAAGSKAECPKQENGKALRWCYKWLQRFTQDGEPYGEPFDLDEVLPEVIHSVNWEGLGWFEPGKRLVLVYDEKIDRRRVAPQEAFVMELPQGW